jgi:hypothetical protein
VVLLCLQAEYYPTQEKAMSMRWNPETNKYEDVPKLKVFCLKMSDKDRAILKGAVAKLERIKVEKGEWGHMISESAFARQAIVEAAKAIVVEAKKETPAKSGKTKRRPRKR